MGSCNFKVYIMMRGTLVAKRTKAVRGRWYACTAGGWKDAETLNVPKPLRTGTGAIRQELLINSHLSAPQA